MPTDDVGLSDEDDLGIEEFAAKIEGARLIPGVFSSLSSDSARTSYIFAEYLDEVFRTGSLATLDNEALGASSIRSKLESRAEKNESNFS